MKDLIETRLLSYVHGDISRQEFEGWFIPATWHIDRLGDEATSRLVKRIKLRLAEYLNGDWTERELREQLAGLVTESRVLRYQVMTLDAFDFGLAMTSSTGEVREPVLLVA